VSDVSVYYFLRRGLPDGNEVRSKRRATLEAIKGWGIPVMESRRIVDHTEVDGNGFLIGGASEESDPIGELWPRIRSLESRAKSRNQQALEITDEAGGHRKAELLLESFELRNEARALRDRLDPPAAVPSKIPSLAWAADTILFGKREQR
jgi:hypothetical protein